MDMPEKIYVTGRYVCYADDKDQDGIPAKDRLPEYIRADLIPAALKDAREALQELIDDAKEDFPNVYKLDSMTPGTPVHDGLAAIAQIDNLTAGKTPSQT